MEARRHGLLARLAPAPLRGHQPNLPAARGLHGHASRAAAATSGMHTLWLCVPHPLGNTLHLDGKGRSILNTA